MPRTLVAGALLIAIALSGCESSNAPSSPGTIEAAPYEAALSAPSEVREAQRALNALGFDAGTADGVLGPRTRSAITDYQARSGLAETGELTAPLLQQLRRKAEKLQATRARPAPKASRPPQTTKAAVSAAEAPPPATTTTTTATNADAAACDNNETSGELGSVPRLSDPD